MTEPTHLAVGIRAAFEEISCTSMAGLPIVNPMLEVAAIGFASHEGRPYGIILTPWMMSLAVFPGDDEDWSAVQVGDKREFHFPARAYEFLANQIDGIGTYYGFALYSPMHEFEYQDHAVASAEAFLEVLMVPNEDPDAEVDEKRLAAFLDGEDMESIKQRECAAAQTAADGAVTLSDEAREPLNRRQLLSGNLQTRVPPSV